MEKYGRAGEATDDKIVRRLRIICWKSKATDTHSDCVILITFLRGQWLLKRASMLGYTYIVCLVIYI